MASSPELRPLVLLYQQRKARARAEMTRLEQLRQEGREAGAEIDRQIDSVRTLLGEQMARTGMMDKSALYESRRHLAVLLRRQLDLRQQRLETDREMNKLEKLGAEERVRMTGFERKRGKYQDWLNRQRRARLAWRDRLEQLETEERTSWCKR